jgi:L-fucose isomerase-like protein
MSRAKVALVAVASRAESGGERAEAIFNGAREALKRSGLEVEAAGKVVWDAAAALEVAEEFSNAEPDLVVIIHATWVLDSLQYLLVNTLRCPAVLWAVPFTETFSLGCVQHFGSILWDNGIAYKYVYGLPDDRELVEQIHRYAGAASAVRELRKARIALIGPRQTWRVAGPQDMTCEEWDLTRALGVTIVHVEMDELIGQAQEHSQAESEAVLERMHQSGRLGRVEVERDRLLYAGQVYLGVRDLFDRYGLTGAAAECYPNYSGLVNLPSSWLADEGLILDTEGDLGHTVMMSILNDLGPAAPTALAEVGRLDLESNSLLLAHEGSSAHSLAEDGSEVHIFPAGENGTVVGFPLKPLPVATIVNLSGKAGQYRMLVAKGSSERVSLEEWKEAGSKFVARIRMEGGALAAFERMLAQGVDHHLLVREGDFVAQLKDLCDLLGIAVAEQRGLLP